MQRQSSPFAALTSKEQLERWREFQSIRLPYIQGDVDNASRPTSLPPPSGKPFEDDPPSKQEKSKREANARSASPSEQAQWQKTRHQQYDAVMQRMVSASRKAVRFEAIK